MSAIEAKHKERLQVEYSFTLRLKGLLQEANDLFASGLDGWTITSSPGSLFMYPLAEPVFEGNLDGFIDHLSSNYDKVLETSASIGTSRELSIAIHYDSHLVAALCPSMNATTIRRLADWNFSIQLCMFPTNFDDKGTQE